MTTLNSLGEHVLRSMINEAHKALDRAKVDATKWITHSVSGARQEVTLSLAERIDLLAAQRKPG